MAIASNGRIHNDLVDKEVEKVVRKNDKQPAGGYEIPDDDDEDQDEDEDEDEDEPNEDDGEQEDDADEIDGINVDEDDAEDIEQQIVNITSKKNKNQNEAILVINNQGD